MLHKTYYITVYFLRGVSELQLLTYWAIALGTAFFFFIALELLKKWLLLRVQEKEELPFLTLALIVKNADKVIEGTVRSLLKLPYCQKNGSLNYEIIVVDCGSTDQTGEILERMSRLSQALKVHRNNGCLEPEKLVLELSQGEKVVFLDERCLKKHHLMSLLGKYLSGEKVIDLRKEVKRKLYPWC